MFDFCEKRKKFVFHTRELKYKFFSINSKLRVHHTHVLSLISVACVEHIEISNYYKIVIKNKFFSKNFYFFWFTENKRYFSTTYKISTQLSPTEFY